MIENHRIFADFGSRNMITMTMIASVDPDEHSRIACQVSVNAETASEERYHESESGNCDPCRILVRNEWRECIPVKGQWLPIVSELRPSGACEPVVLLLKSESQGAAQAN
jgi:hypothetical protein